MSVLHCALLCRPPTCLSGSLFFNLNKKERDFANTMLSGSGINEKKSNQLLELNNILVEDRMDISLIDACLQKYGRVCFRDRCSLFILMYFNNRNTSSKEMPVKALNYNLDASSRKRLKNKVKVWLRSIKREVANDVILRNNVMQQKSLKDQKFLTLLHLGILSDDGMFNDNLLSLF